MSQPRPAETRSTIIPCMRYRDAKAAISWLCNTFGLHEQFVASDEEDTIAHAQLSFGNGMVMIGSVRETQMNRLMRQPDEINGACTQSAYVIVDDVDSVYAKARAANAQILVPVQDEAYGGRSFACRDLEGHIWNFGSYDPWSPQGTSL